MRKASSSKISETLEKEARIRHQDRMIISSNTNLQIIDRNSTSGGSGNI